jgi:hypothetical protein
MHNHSHNHNHGEVSAEDEAIALVKYMAHHNESHTAELIILIDKLNSLNNQTAIDLVKGAIEEYKKGNALLDEAIKEFENGGE